MLYLKAAEGALGTVLYLQVDPTLEEDAFNVKEVKCLHPFYSKEFGRQAFLGVCKTRAGNATMWAWWWARVAEYAVKTRARLKELGALKEYSEWFSVTCDGENGQVNATLTKETRALLKKSKVNPGKLAAQSSLAASACDKSPVHRTFKQCVNTQQVDAVLGNTVKAHLTQILATLYHKQPSQSKLNTVVENLAQAVAIGAQAFKAKDIKTGFRLAAHYPQSFQMAYSNWSGVILNNEEFKRVEAAIPKLASRMASNGELTTTDYDEHGVPKSKTEEEQEAAGRLPRDKRTLVERHAVLLMSDEVVKRIQKQKEDKLREAAEAKAEKIQAAQKKKEREEKKQANRDATCVETREEEETGRRPRQVCFLDRKDLTRD